MYRHSKKLRNTARHLFLITVFILIFSFTVCSTAHASEQFDGEIIFQSLPEGAEIYLLFCYNKKVDISEQPFDVEDINIELKDNYTYKIVDFSEIGDESSSEDGTYRFYMHDENPKKFAVIIRYNDNLTVSNIIRFESLWNYVEYLYNFKTNELSHTASSGRGMTESRMFLIFLVVIFMISQTIMMTLEAVIFFLLKLIKINKIKFKSQYIIFAFIINLLLMVLDFCIY